MPGLRERKKELKRALEDGYETWTEQANVILSIIRAAKRPAERVALMTHTIRNFHSDRKVKSENVRARAGIQLSENVFSEIRDRISGSVAIFIVELFTANEEPELAARRILHFLDQYPIPDERAVAFAMLLRQHLPYARLPSDLYGDPLTADGVKKISERGSVSASIKRIREVINTHLHRPEMTLPILATALQRIIVRHSEPREQQVLIGEIIWNLRIYLLEQDQEVLLDTMVPLQDLKRILERVRRGGGCDDSDCSIHGAGKKLKEDPSN